MAQLTLRPVIDSAPGRLLGRDAETRLLDRLVAGLAEGRSARVGVTGLPGVGRSALLRRVVASARDAGLAAGLARCSPIESQVPYSAVTHLLAELFSPAQFAELAAACFADSCLVPVSLLCEAFVDLARGRPVVLALDDLQWADAWSARWFDAMSRRAHQAPVLLAAAAHDRIARHLDHDSAFDAAFVAPLHELRVAPLGEAEVAALAGEELAAAALDVTRGHPAVLHEVIARGATRENLAAVGRAVWSEQAVRLVRGLPPDAVELLRVLSVCGEDFELATLLARPTSGSFADALDHLRVSGLVSGTRLAHPWLGAEVLAAMDTAERAALYLRAAELGNRSAAAATAVADLLCAAPPTGRAWAGTVLTEASAQRLRQGQVVQAAEALRRALAEPMAPEERGDMLIRLSAIEAVYAPEASDGRLRQILTSPELRPSVVTAADLLLGRGDAETTRRAASELCREATLPASEAKALSALGWLAQEEAAAEPEIPVAPLPAPADRVTDAAEAGVLAWRLATRCEDRDRVRSLAFAALAGGAPLMPRIAACRALLCSYELDEAIAGLDAVLADARRRDARPIAAQALLYRAVGAVRAGRPEEAVQDLATAVRELPRRCWHPSLVPRLVCGELTAYVRLGRLDLAAQLVEAPSPRGAEHGTGWAFQLYGVAETRLALGQPESALAALRECGRILRSRRWVNPMLIPWRTMAGIALRQLGDPEAAERLFTEELALAEGWGSGPAMAAVREQAVADIGLIFPAGHVPEPPADGLSAREREVAVLAARGLANREIARELGVAVRTVELRLTKVYRKLGLAGRAELAARWEA